MRATRRRHTKGRGDGQPGRADLPELDAEVTLLEAEDTDVRPPLHALTINEVLLSGASGESTATWVDTGRHAQTTSLHELAPAPRVLGRIHVARGFTAFQHHALIREAVHRIDATTVAVVALAVDAIYRESDLPRERAREYLLQTVAHLTRVARRYNVPVIVSRARSDDLGEIVAEAASDTLTYRETRCGPRFEGSSHETLVYDVGDGWVQTTLAYWQQVLETRRPLYASADDDVPTPGEVA